MRHSPEARRSGWLDRGPAWWAGRMQSASVSLIPLSCIDLFASRETSTPHQRAQENEQYINTHFLEILLPSSNAIQLLRHQNHPSLVLSAFSITSFYFYLQLHGFHVTVFFFFFCPQVSITSFMSRVCK